MNVFIPLFGAKLLKFGKLDLALNPVVSPDYLTSASSEA